MTLIENRCLADLQAVVKRRLPRVVVGPAAGDDVDGLARRRARAHQFVPGRALRQIVKVQVADEQVFENVARHQLLPELAAVKKSLPASKCRLLGSRARCDFNAAGTGIEPVTHGLEFVHIKTGKGVGHAPQGFVLIVQAELIGPGAALAAVKAKLKAVGQRAVSGGQRVFLFQGEHLVQGALGDVTVIQHRIETPAAPLLGSQGIFVQACQVGGEQTGAVVHFVFAGAALQANPVVQLELAGGVVTTVADHAALLNDGLYQGRIVFARAMGGKGYQQAGKCGVELKPHRMPSGTRLFLQTRTNPCRRWGPTDTESPFCLPSPSSQCGWVGRCRVQY